APRGIVFARSSRDGTCRQLRRARRARTGTWLALITTQAVDLTLVANTSTRGGIIERRYVRGRPPIARPIVFRPCGPPWRGRFCRHGELPFFPALSAFARRPTPQRPIISHRNEKRQLVCPRRRPPRLGR